MQHPGGWQRCTEEPGIAMHGVHHCEQWTANRKRERYNMDVYLIRHGKTKGNLEGRYIGTTDEPLCEEGKQSLMQMADAKKYPAVEALFVSPMLRCRESAKILFPKQSISVVSDLRECDIFLPTRLLTNPLGYAWEEKTGFKVNSILEVNQKGLS